MFLRFPPHLQIPLVLHPVYYVILGLVVSTVDRCEIAMQREMFAPNSTSLLQRTQLTQNSYMEIMELWAFP